MEFKNELNEVIETDFEDIVNSIDKVFYSLRLYYDYFAESIDMDEEDRKALEDLINETPFFKMACFYSAVRDLFFISKELFETLPTLPEHARAQLPKEVRTFRKY